MLQRVSPCNKAMWAVYKSVPCCSRDNRYDAGLDDHDAQIEVVTGLVLVRRSTLLPGQPAKPPSRQQIDLLHEEVLLDLALN